MTTRQCSAPAATAAFTYAAAPSERSDCSFESDRVAGAYASGDLTPHKNYEMRRLGAGLWKSPTKHKAQQLGGNPSSGSA
jgi:hypothetical protein